MVTRNTDPSPALITSPLSSDTTPASSNVDTASKVGSAPSSPRSPSCTESSVSSATRMSCMSCSFIHPPLTTTTTCLAVAYTAKRAGACLGNLDSNEGAEGALVDFAPFGSEATQDRERRAPHGGGTDATAIGRRAAPCHGRAAPRSGGTGATAADRRASPQRGRRERSQTNRELLTS